MSVLDSRLENVDQNVRTTLLGEINMSNAITKEAD